MCLVIMEIRDLEESRFNGLGSVEVRFFEIGLIVK